MKQFLGKKVFLKVLQNKTVLNYTGTITSVTKTHISFKDKFDLDFCYRIADIIKLEPFNENKQKYYNDGGSR